MKNWNVVVSIQLQNLLAAMCLLNINVATAETWTCDVKKWEEWNGQPSDAGLWVVDTNPTPNPCMEPLTCIQVINNLARACPQEAIDENDMSKCSPAKENYLKALETSNGMWAIQPGSATHYLILSKARNSLSYTTIMPDFPGGTVVQPLYWAENCLIEE